MATPHLRGATSQYVINVAGFVTCGWYKKATNLIASLHILLPDKIKHEDTAFATREEFKEWLHANRENYGPKASEHGSSPFVTINGQFLGGCDDTIAWARKLMSNAALPPMAGVGPSAHAHVDPWNPEHGYEYDLVVIGGGSGGLACSKEAAALGARVALLDFVKPTQHGTSWGLGGTCVNVGCIPKKLMHTAALLGESVTDMAPYGWSVSKTGPHSWEGLRESVQNHIRSLNFGYRVSLRDKNVTYLNKLGTFTGPHELKVVDKKGKEGTLTAARFVVAVGGRPQPLECPGGELAITSDDLFSLDKPPGKTCVVGAGYVALECAGFMTALGYDVTVLVRSILLRGFDRECCDMIGKHMEEHGTRVVVGVTPTAVEKQADGRLLVRYSDGNSDVFDTVMSARGRYADLQGMNIEAAGLRVNAKSGKLECELEQTNVPHIYAIGDVIHGKPELTPVAIQAGQLLARRLFGGSEEQMDYRNVATTVFTPLEYGCVGLSEDDALAEMGADNVEVYHSSFTPLEWSIVPERSHTNAFAKVIVSQIDDRVIGMHFLGPNAGEVIQGYGVAVKAGITYSQLLSTVGIHPTVAEEFTTLTVSKSSGESAQKAGC